VKTKVILLFATIFCIVLSGYCFAGEKAPTKGPVNNAKAEAAPARSVSEVQKADAAVKNVIDVKNAGENSSVKFEVLMVNNKKIENITIPQGQELVIDQPISADVINIQGGGSIKLVDFGSINATDSLTINMVMISMENLPQFNDKTNTGTGATISIQSNPGPNPVLVDTAMSVVSVVSKSPIKNHGISNQQKGHARVGSNIGTTAGEGKTE